MSGELRSALAVVVGGILMLAAGCSQTVGARTETSQPPKSVVTVVAQTTTVERTTTQPATVHAFYEARVLAKMSGYLRKLNVDIGTQVKAGDVLAEIDVPEMVKQFEREQAVLSRLDAQARLATAGVVVAAAGVAAAESSLLEARADEQRAVAQLKADDSERRRVNDLVGKRALADRLLDEAIMQSDASRAAKSATEATSAAAVARVEVARAKHVVAQAELASAQADVEVGKKRLEELQTLMGYAELRSPFDGVVVERSAEPGELVRNSQNTASSEPLFVIARLDIVRVRVAVPERDAPWAGEGDTANVTFQALPGEEFTGPISRTAAVLAPSTRTLLVEIDLPNPQGKLLPGMFGQAKILLASHDNRVTLPAQAVRFDEQGGSYVYVVDADSRIQVVDVETGSDDGQRIEITSGLDGGQRVVGPMLRRLTADEKVLVKG